MVTMVGDSGTSATLEDEVKPSASNFSRTRASPLHRDSAPANIRRHVKRLLRKYGYPPDLQDAAVQNVLQQAEALSAEWAA